MRLNELADLQRECEPVAEKELLRVVVDDRLPVFPWLHGHGYMVL
jgi:hypothetical protein